MRSVLKIFFLIISAIGIVIIAPFISFWLAYFGGWLCSLVIGEVLTEGLNTLFNTTYFTPDIIPICAGALGWIGGYFKNSSTSINKKEDKKTLWKT
jgi:hypothetical protein